jgi:hypothetical protein
MTVHHLILSHRTLSVKNEANSTSLIEFYIQYLVNAHWNLGDIRLTYWTFHYEAFMIKAHTRPQTIIT